jgi:hypothetical protein
MLTIKQARILQVAFVILPGVCVGAQLLRPWSDHVGQCLVLLIVGIAVLQGILFGKIIALLQLEGKR